MIIPGHRVNPEFGKQQQEMELVHSLGRSGNAFGLLGLVSSYSKTNFSNILQQSVFPYRDCPLPISSCPGLPLPSQSLLTASTVTQYLMAHGCGDIIWALLTISRRIRNCFRPSYLGPNYLRDSLTLPYKVSGQSGCSPRYFQNLLLPSSLALAFLWILNLGLGIK